VQETNKKIIKTKRAKRRTEENKRYCYNSSVNFIAVSGLCEAAEYYCQDFWSSKTGNGEYGSVQTKTFLELWKTETRKDLRQYGGTIISVVVGGGTFLTDYKVIDGVLVWCKSFRKAVNL